MPQRLKRRCLNVVLISTFVALCLACGGDPEDPPPGSIWEKLCGDWVSDPIPLIDGDRVDGTTTIKIDMSYWNVGLIASYPDEPALRNRESVASHKTRCNRSRGRVLENKGLGGVKGSFWHQNGIVGSPNS